MSRQRTLGIFCVEGDWSPGVRRLAFYLQECGGLGTDSWESGTRFLGIRDVGGRRPDLLPTMRSFRQPVATGDRRV